MPGVVWPGLATAPGAAMLALQFQLERSQWWDAERLHAQQQLQLRALRAHAVRHVPRYRGLDPAAPLESWPVIGKAELAADPAAFRAVEVPGEHGGRWEGSTTGSTGMPVRLAGTDLVKLFNDALVLRSQLWHEFDFGARFASVYPHAPGGRQEAWSPVSAAVFQNGPAVTMDIGTDAAALLDWLLEERPAYLQSRPGTIGAILDAGEGRGVHPQGLEAVVCMSEVLPERTRRRVRELWGARVIDTYSCAEFGLLALECPEEGRLHVQSETVIVELLREDGSACAPGETGRVLVTGLHNFAMPLVRYALGDYAEAGAPCACGRGLPVLGRVIGRERNMARDPSGRVFWPSFPAALWLAVAPIRQLQIVQHDPARLEVRYVMGRALTGGECDRLRAVLRESLKYAYAIEFSQVETILRRPGEKYEEFVSRIGAP